LKDVECAYGFGGQFYISLEEKDDGNFCSNGGEIKLKGCDLIVRMILSRIWLRIRQR
jgi:hypothetical protein